MHKILINRLEKLQGDLEKEIGELKEAFIPKNRKPILNREELLAEYKKEGDLCKKYKTDRLNITQVIVDLDFALEDLNVLLFFEKRKQEGNL